MAVLGLHVALRLVSSHSSVSCSSVLPSSTNGRYGDTRRSSHRSLILKKPKKKEHHLWKKRESAGSGQKALNLVRCAMEDSTSTESVHTPTSSEIQRWMDEDLQMPNSSEFDRWLDEELEDMENEATSRTPPRPCRTRPFTGYQLVTDILSGHPNRCVDEFRMSVGTFRRLHQTLDERGLLKSSHISTTEQLAIFLYLAGHGASNRTLAEKFQHLNETISRHLHTVVNGICTLMTEFIKQPSGDLAPHPKILSSNWFFPYFQDALGAIYGTYIPIVVQGEDLRICTRNRKGVCSQNIMAAVNFDMEFLFLMAGWEGSAQDMRVLRSALIDHDFVVPPGKYYLADAGYANTCQFLAPYRGTRYHISEYRHRRFKHTSPQDLFNHRHAQLRNVVERTFGLWKQRFQILRNIPRYSYKMQTAIILACGVLHNFIMKHARDDDVLLSTIDSIPIDHLEDENQFVESEELTADGSHLRSSITTEMWEDDRRNHDI